MAKPSQTSETTPRRPDADEYSATTARENREYAEARMINRGASLKPGGAFGAPMDVGMSSLDRATVPSEAEPENPRTSEP